MDGPRDYYTKWNTSEKDKYYMISLIYRIWKKKDTSEFTYKAERDLWTKKTNLQLPKGKEKGRDKLGAWD